MIQFKLFRQYSQITNSLAFTINAKKPYLILYFSENSTFFEDYKKLNFRKIDFRHVIVPNTKIPYTRLTSELRTKFKKLGLYTFSSNQKVPSNKNIIIDISYYLQSIDEKYKPKTYRQRSGFLIQNLILKILASYPSNYQKIIMYSVDINNPMNTFVNRKIFPILQQIKDEEILFDNVILNTISNETSSYRLLIKDRKYNFSRIYQYLKRIKNASEDGDDEEIEENLNKATDKIVSKIKDHVQPKNKLIYQNSIKHYLRDIKNQDIIDNIVNDDYEEPNLYKIASASIFYKLNGNLNKSTRIASNIKNNNSATVLKSIDKKYTDELLVKTKSQSTSNNIQIQEMNPSGMVDGKTPQHIFDKRKIDFEINLKKDLLNSFNVLNNKDIPLKVENLEIIDKPIKKGEIHKSDLSIVKVTLKSPSGKKHTVNIEIPKINEDGTFRSNGQRKLMINQIILCPITFPKPYDSKFQSSYSAFHIHSKKTKQMEYLEVYMGSYKLPYMILLLYFYGLERVAKKYNIDYVLTTEPPKNYKWYSKLDSEKYIVFKNVDTQLKRELCQSFIKTKIDSYDINEEFGSKEYFNKLLIKITGRMNSTFLLTSNFENIVEPVVQQVLANKHLPTELEEIMYYMASNVVNGITDDRNDLNNQRIRNSEVIVHLIQKQILASYTEYKEQYLSGNKDAKFNINQTKVLSEFNRTEIVTTIEYANPVEEMSTMTRVTPVGKKIGGIPDKGAISTSSRNVHKSYYGNIDPLDTPEGENIGIVQQLTVDAMITSARGLFNTKNIDHEGSGLLSTTTSLIPFIENNDGARVMMASAQAKQTLPLTNPEAPIVQSGYESLLTNVLSDNFIKKAKCSGKVIEATNDFITIQSKNGKCTHNITPIHLKSGSGIDTLSIFESKVKPGQTIKEGQIIAEGSCVKDGSIAQGRTLLTAVMSYKGYNFEDGIVISDALVDKKLTSVHGIEIEFEVSEKDKVLYIPKIGEYIEKGKPLIRKLSGELEELIGYSDLEEEDIITSEGQIILKSPGGRVVDIEVFSNIHDEEKFNILKDLIKRTDKKYDKPSNEKYTIGGDTIKGILIKYRIEQERQIGLGDKLANRYGAKGIISLVEKEELMPKTPWGERIQIIVNPVGIIGRMNMGQLYELYTGLISKALAIKVLSLNNQEKIANLYNNTLRILDKSKDQKFSKKMITAIKAMNKSVFNEYMNQIKQLGFVPIIIPPFKAPSYKEIIQVMNVLQIKDGYDLFLPEFNTKTYNSVPVGYMYFQKLEHIGDMKIHSRSTGPVKGKTLHPTAGKKAEGAQRIGELDTYSLISYNTPLLISEFFGPLSDDIATKNEMISDIIQGGSTKFKEVKTSPIKDLLKSYFISLMLEGQ